MKTGLKTNINKRNLVITLISLFVLLAAWFSSTKIVEPNLVDAFNNVFPTANYFSPLSGDVYGAYTSSARDELLGYVVKGEAEGYGGPIQVAVAENLTGEIIGVSIIDTKETPAYLQRVLRNKFVNSLLGKNFQHAFKVDDDLDGVSGATYTVVGIAEAVHEASKKIAGSVLEQQVSPDPIQKIMVGSPEIVLLGLFLATYIAQKPARKYLRQFRWGIAILSIVTIGVLFNRQLTIAFIDKLILGYWPVWQNNIYWYLLLAYFILSIFITNKNQYCLWICPFGAVQKCMGAIGDAKGFQLGKWRSVFLWTQRIFAFLAIFLGIFYRSPSIASYEIFGTLFSLTGSNFQFGLLGIVIIASIFIYQPWCTYLCPIKPIGDLLLFSRKNLLIVLEKVKK